MENCLYLQILNVAKMFHTAARLANYADRRGYHKACAPSISLFNSYIRYLKRACSLESNSHLEAETTSLASVISADS